MSRILSFALLSILCTNSANADLYSASNALSRGEYEVAVAEFTRLAEKGDDKAQANLGYMYYVGEGVPQDYKQAVYWYRKAGVQGNKDAQYNLAVSYAFGEGVAQDLTEAAIWYRRAAEQGHVVSQYSLGISYAYGEGVPQDQKEAARWFRKAADQGYSRAQVYLGSMYHTGEGVAQDYFEAVRWYRMAADRGDATAQYNLGTMYRSGKGVEQNYSQAKRWFRQSADQGYAAAQNEMASLERSAASNISTRTVQAKPEIYPTNPVEPITKEEIAETINPEPTAAEKPVQEEKIVSNEATASAPETKKITEPSNTNGTVKKPLFSVDKKDLLTLDSSQLDIPEPIDEPETSTASVPDVKEKDVVEVETPAEEEIVKNFPVADVSVDANEADKPEVSDMHRAMGLPQPKPAQEKEEGKPSKNLFTAIGNLFSSDDDSKTEEMDTNSETEEATMAISESEAASTTIELESVTKTESMLETDPVDVEEVIETETVVKEYVAAEDPTLLINEPINIEKIAETETVVDEYVAAEDPTLLTEPVVIEEVTETQTAVNEYVAAEDPTLLTEPTANEEVEEETESSGGFFSAIGKLFSGKKKPSETETVEEEAQIKEEIVVAKLDEPAPITEEIALANEIEDDLSQYSVDAGRSALLDKNYTEAEKQFRTLAEAGDSEAQSHLGSLYYVGSGVEQSFVSAFLWYKKAADQGNTDAQYSLGNMYLLGEGIEQNYEEAAKWYSFASEKGHVAATSNLNNLRKLDALASQAPLETPVEIEEVSTTKPFEEEEATPSIVTGNYATEPNTEQVEQTINSALQEEMSDKEATVEEYVAESDPTLLKTNTETVAEETESSGGFFSAIGDFFSGEEKPTEAELAKGKAPIEEEMIIANVDEPTAAIEEIELAQDVEDDLSQYSVDAGQRALVDSDFDAALKQFKPLAEAGDSEAQSHLGSLYYAGKGVEKSIDTSLSWYKKAADQGNVDAQYSLGNMYLLGEGVVQNNEEAAVWYTLASVQGHVAATNNLNNLKKLDALNRENKLEQYAEAKQEFNTANSTETTNVKSYAAGNAPSTESLQAYSDIESREVVANVKTEIEPVANELVSDTEESTQISNSESIQDAELTSKQSEFFEGLFGESETETTRLKADDSINLDVRPAEETITETTAAKIEAEAETPQDLALLGPELDQPVVNSDEISSVEEAIVEIEPVTELDQLRSLATQGDQDAQYKLGTLHYSGDGVKQDFSKSALWYRRAAQQGNLDAQYSLGNMYLMGEGVEQDNQQAAHWYALATEQGHVSAKHNLTNLQRSMHSSTQLEIETNKVEDEQITIIEINEDEGKTADESISDATGKSEYQQGLAYAFGDGVPQNDRNAFNLFYAAAEKGYALAQYKVGVAYAYGEGVRQDNKEAAEWYQKAAVQGYTIAQRNLAMMYLDGNGIQQDKVHALAWYNVVASQGNAMDIRRRDILEKELSETELSQSQEISNQISSRLSSNSSL